MPAYRAHLSPQFHRAWMEGALTSAEAWALEDQFLLSTEELVEIPSILSPQVSKFALWQHPGENSLPL